MTEWSGKYAFLPLKCLTDVSIVYTLDVVEGGEIEIRETDKR